jgi:hypothetical protein
VEVSEVLLVTWICLNFRLLSNGVLFVKSLSYKFGFAFSSVLRIMARVGKMRGETGVW